MINQYSSAAFLVIAVVFILAGFLLAFALLTRIFEKSGFEFLSGFNMYLFGMATALTLAIIGGLLLFFRLHTS